MPAEPLTPWETTAFQILATRERKPVKIAALFRCAEDRGDHAADVEIAVEPLINETVAQFFARLAEQYTGGARNPAEKAVLEIRMVAEGEVC